MVPLPDAPPDRALLGAQRFEASQRRQSETSEQQEEAVQGPVSIRDPERCVFCPPCGSHSANRLMKAPACRREQTLYTHSRPCSVYTRTIAALSCFDQLM